MFNFPRVNQTLSVMPKGVERADKSDIILGFHAEINDEREFKRTICNDFICALLIHDKVVLQATELLSLFAAFGIEDTLLLLSSGIFELISDKSSSPAIFKGQETFSLGFIADAYENTVFDTGLGRVEERLNRRCKDSALVKSVLFSAEKYLINIDGDKLEKIITKELQSDLINKNLLDRLSLSTNSLGDIAKPDVYKLLRLASVNQSLVYGSEVGADSMSIDGEAKKVINDKCSPVIREQIQNSATIDIFQKIYNQKQLPDLTTAYLNKAISIDDIISIRSNFQGKLFRHWFASIDYDYEATIQMLLSRPKLNNLTKITKAMRWGLPTVVGIANPFLGAISGLADTYIVDRILKGWHPSLFLDEVLQDTVDRKIQLHDQQQKRLRLKTLFPAIGRNDPCPCGSGKKYKKCCWS